MGLILTIGDPSTVLDKPTAILVTSKIKAELGISVSIKLLHRGKSSEELAWSGWRKLQTSATEILGAEQIPHLLAVDAWFGVYLGHRIEPITLEIGSGIPPLQCASLPSLIEEIELYGQTRELATEDERLKQMWTTYMSDDNLVDRDFDVQVYLQLLHLARLGMKRRMPLWVVK